MLTLVINLDDSTDRMAVAKAQLDREGIAFERFAAVDSRALKPKDFDSYDPEKAIGFFSRELTGGELGCYISHLRCAKRFLESSEKIALILEDDMQLPSGAKLAIEEIADWCILNQNLKWDLINLCQAPKKFTTDLVSFNGNKLCKAHYFPLTTTALIWSREGATAFWQTRKKVYAPVDHFLRYWCGARNGGLAMSPALITTTGAESVIDNVTDVRDTPRTPTYFFCEFRRQKKNYLNAYWNKFVKRR